MDGFNQIDFKEIEDIPDGVWEDIQNIITSEYIVPATKIRPEKTAPFVEMRKSGKVETCLEKTILFLAFMVALASIASITMQMIALTEPLQILEGFFIDLLLIISIMAGYKVVFGFWVWQSGRGN
jgi:hypothetical protein